ncbi:MAG TPA: cupredoxin domain-containing protein [Symbiobacteriaceae bacterium]
MKHRLRLGIVLVAVLAAGCGVQRTPPAAPGPHPVNEATHVLSVQQGPVPIAQQMAGQTGIIRLEISDRGFSQSRLTAALDGRVKIYIHNAGSTRHNLTIPRWGVVTRALEPGEENYVEFTANERGDWPYYSDAPGQEESGLSGILKVE